MFSVSWKESGSKSKDGYKSWDAAAEFARSLIISRGIVTVSIHEED